MGHPTVLFAALLAVVAAVALLAPAYSFVPVPTSGAEPGAGVGADPPGAVRDEP